MGFRLEISRLLNQTIQLLIAETGKRHHRRTRALVVRTPERLESRCLLTPQISLAPSGVLMISGSEKSDTAEVTQTAGGTVQVSLSNDEISLNRNYPANQVQSLLFYGGDGNDTFRNETDLPSEAHGESGNDILFGGGAMDLLFGELGDDLLLGRGGDDQLFGSDGHDVLKGHNGKDQLVGGPGNDLLIGGANDDQLSGGDGHDVLKGGTGSDHLDGGNGNDQLFGQGGLDVLLESSGSDLLDQGTELDTEGVAVGSQSSVGGDGNTTVHLILHVTDFGAVGDGITDDTKAVQAALDAAEGNELYLDPGTYLISDALLIPSNTILSGAGSNSILKFKWRDQSEGREFHLGNKNRGNHLSGDRNIELRDFVIEGGDTGDPYGPTVHGVTHGISFRKAMNVKVSRVEIRYTSGFSISNIGLVNGTFIGNTIRNVGRDGITSFPLVNQDDPEFMSYPLNNLFISHNKFENVGDDAIAVHAGTEHAINYTLAPSNITITNNIIVGRSVRHELSQGRGIALTGVRHATIDGNQISSTVSSGILIQSWYNNAADSELARESIRSYNVLVTNNSLIEIGSAEGLDRVKIGIQVKGADRIRLANNLLRRAAGRGIDIRNTAVIEVVANEVYGSLGKSAILLVGGADYDVVNAIVSDNIIEHWNEEDLVMYNVVNGKEVSGASNPLVRALMLRSSAGINENGGTTFGSGVVTSVDNGTNKSYLPAGVKV
ncbi:MAG: glycosyl hydrolase family 28-related protein [Planctomycetaceae bacterium]